MAAILSKIIWNPDTNVRISNGWDYSHSPYHLKSNLQKVQISDPHCESLGYCNKWTHAHLLFFWFDLLFLFCFLNFRSRISVKAWPSWATCTSTTLSALPTGLTQACSERDTKSGTGIENSYQMDTRQAHIRIVHKSLFCKLSGFWVPVRSL